MILGTVVFQSLTAKFVAKKLGINNPEPNGVLFFGANEIALALAQALRHESVKVMMSDTSWRNVRTARQAGFEAYHGNPTSGHAAENLDLQGIGKLIAVSSSRDANALAGMHFRKEFGSSQVFTLEGASDDEAYQRFDTANRNRANPLFDASLNPSRLSRLLRDGEVRHVTLVEPSKAPEKPRTDQTEPDADTTAEPLPPVDEVLGTAPEVMAMAGSAETDASENGGTEHRSGTDVGRQERDARPGDDDSADGGSEFSSAIDEEALKTATELKETRGEALASGQLAGDAQLEVDEASAEAAFGEGAIDEDDLRLFAIDPEGKFYIYGAGEKFTPRPGWRVIVLGEQHSAESAREEVPAPA